MSGRFVDDPIKEMSRYCAREFATKKDPTVFAAASDVNNSAIIDLLAVKKGYPIMLFDAAAAFSQAEEQELVFLERPIEYQMMCNKPVLWQCLKVREGRRTSTSVSLIQRAQAGSREARGLRACATARIWTSLLTSTLMTATRHARHRICRRLSRTSLRSWC